MPIIEQVFNELLPVNYNRKQSQNQYNLIKKTMESDKTQEIEYYTPELERTQAHFRLKALRTAESVITELDACNPLLTAIRQRIDTCTSILTI